MLLGAELQKDRTTRMVRLALLHPAFLDLRPARPKHLGPSVGQAEVHRDRATPPTVTEHQGAEAT